MDISKAMSLIKDTSKLVSQIYEDLAQPGVKQVGIALESVLGLSNTLLLPLRLINEKSNEIFKANMNKFRKKMEEIPNERINQVPPQLGLPIIERLTYISDEELSDLFINLLSTASDTDTFSLSHPSFVQLIDRLSIDEARILNYLKGMEYIPYINFQLKKVGNTGYLNLKKHQTGIEKRIDLLNPQNINLYYDNLKSMGLIYSDDLSHKTLDELYFELETFYKSEIEFIENNKEYDGYLNKITIEKGYFEITDLGKKFIISCTKKLIDKGDITHLYGKKWKLESEIDGEFFKKGLKIKHEKNGEGIILGTQLDDIIIVKYSKIGTVMIVGPKTEEFELI